MIPKTIHYCWFGGNPKPELVCRCIESWKRFCPDYEIIEWNETNFDVNCIPYVRDAYAAKKWAFVSDYVRLRVVFERGGVYLDTDVELKSNLDDLLEHDCWLASDDVRYINTGLGFGAVKEHFLIGAMMDAYQYYKYPSGTNVTRDSGITEHELPEWEKSNRTQIIRNGICLIGLNDYGQYAKHLYMYTWGSEEEQKKRNEALTKGNTCFVRAVWKIKCAVRSPRMIAYFDKRRGRRSEKIYTFFAYDFLDNGPVYFINCLIKKIIR